MHDILRYDVCTVRQLLACLLAELFKEINGKGWSVLFVRTWYIGLTRTKRKFLP
jgi:hypothetical protein